MPNRIRTATDSPLSARQNAIATPQTFLAAGVRFDSGHLRYLLLTTSAAELLSFQLNLRARSIVISAGTILHFRHAAATGFPDECGSINRRKSLIIKNILVLTRKITARRAGIGTPAALGANHPESHERHKATNNTATGNDNTVTRQPDTVSEGTSHVGSDSQAGGNDPDWKRRRD